MGRSNNSSGNNNSLISSGESGVVSSSSFSSTYLPNFPPVSATHHHHPPHYSQNHHPHHPHYQLPPSPPIHPQQYINMGHLAAQQFYEATSNNSCGGGGGGSGTPPISGNNVTPPARVYSPLSHGSNSSGSSALSYVSSGSAGVSGMLGPSSSTLQIMEAMNAATVGGSAPSVKCEYEDFPHEPDGGPVKITTWKDHVAVFNMDQVGVMCDVLLQEGDIPRLVDLLATVAKDFSGRSEKILRAQAHVAYHAALEDPRKFPQVYKILETNSFSSQYHAGLQKLWFNAHYKEAEITRGRPLGAVDKYRIRRKFQLPRTIWDGEETVYCFKERSRNSLRQSFALEKYPNLEEKKKLSKETGLTMTQVGNWFKNKRQREKEKMQGKPGAKRPKSAYNTPAALAAAMTPDLLGMMLNSGGVNQAHLHHHHHHPAAAHHHQSHIPPLSPEDLENAIRKARYDEARLKTYIDENMYSQPAPPSVQAVPLSPSNLQSYLHHHHQQHNNGATNNSLSSRSSSQQQHHSHNHQMVLSGKNDITIGIVGSPGTSSNTANNHPQHQQEPSTRANNPGIGASGLTITAIPSPHANPTNNSSPNQNEQSSSAGGNNVDSSPQQQHPNSSGGGGDLYGGASSSRPRSASSNPSPSLGRCGTDMVPYLHSAAAAHHHHHTHHQHNPYHHHHAHLTGYDTGVGPLIHPGATAALSHA